MTRKMLRGWSLAVIMILAVALSACSTSKPQSKTDTGTSPTVQKVTITVENAPRQDDKVNYQLFLDEIARFNKVYPNIEVKPDSYQWDPSTFAARLQGGTAGDLWLVPYTEIKGLIANKAAADITTLMTEAKEPSLADWQEGVLNVVKGPDGKIYGVPVGGYSIGLIYNKVLFQQAGLDPNKPPKTWDELAQYAQKLTDRSKNQAGLALFAKGNQGGWQFLNFAWQAGGDYIKQNGDKWQATLDTAEVTKALQFYKDLRWKYDVLTPNVMLTAGDVFPLMASHQAAMFLGAPEWLDIIGSQQGGKLDEFMVAALPAGPAGAYSQMGGAIRVVNPKSSPEKQKAALTFALWEGFNLDNTTLNTQARAMAGKPVGLPSVPLFKGDFQSKSQAIINKYANVPTNQYADYLTNGGKAVRPEPAVAAQELYAAVDPLVQAVLTDKNADPAALLKAANQSVQTKILDTLKKK